MMAEPITAAPAADPSPVNENPTPPPTMPSQGPSAFSVFARLAERRVELTKRISDQRAQIDRIDQVALKLSADETARQTLDLILEALPYL